MYFFKSLTGTPNINYRNVSDPLTLLFWIPQLWRENLYLPIDLKVTDVYYEAIFSRWNISNCSFEDVFCFDVDFDGRQKRDLYFFPRFAKQRIVVVSPDQRQLRLYSMENKEKIWEIKMPEFQLVGPLFLNDDFVAVCWTNLEKKRQTLDVYKMEDGSVQLSHTFNSDRTFHVRQIDGASIASGRVGISVQYATPTFDRTYFLFVLDLHTGEELFSVRSADSLTFFVLQQKRLITLHNNGQIEEFKFWT